MAIVDCYDKRSGITYVYDSKSYRDKETGRPRAKRKLIGKRDSNGNIVPTRGKKNVTTSEDFEYETIKSNGSQALIDVLMEKNREIDALKKRVSVLEKKLSSLGTIIDKANSIIKQA